MVAGVDRKRLYRVMRSAIQMGVFAAIKPKEAGGAVRFKNNRLSACLREDHPNCLRHMVGPRCPSCFATSKCVTLVLDLLRW